MAKAGFYHCSVNPVGRATGRSAVAAAAYRAGADITDERTGLRHHYALRKGVVDTFIVAPPDAPAWAQDRAKLWNAAEAKEDRANGRIATEIEAGLPHELTADQRRALAYRVASEISQRLGVAVDVAIHAPGDGGDHRNHHMHMMVSHRELGPNGFGAMCNRRMIDKKEKGKVTRREIGGLAPTPQDVTAIRKWYGQVLNEAYAEAGLDIKSEHRSHADRGIAAEPTKHLGPAASAMERRGEATDRGDINREITARNAERERLAAERASLSAAIIDLAAERQKRAEDRAERAAVRTASADRILEAMTEKRATFTRAELGRVLAQEIKDKKERDQLATEILAYAAVIGLREKAGEAVTRYTTREVLAAERGVMKDAAALAEASNGGLSEKAKGRAMKQHRQLDEEQREAFNQLTDKRRLAILAGEAGTGKSTTLAAVRDAYEGAGHHVKGLAWTNAVVQDMQGDGFDASTIASQLHRLDTGAEQWNRKTVVVVDEAAMLSTRALGRVMNHAAKAGAKLILAGDDQQLASIERGGMFGVLRQEHGAAELHTVWRVKDDQQKAAYNHMHAGRFRPALDIFDRAGAINWTETQDEARAALVAQWATDSAARPDKRRFVFAYTNADVDSLNADLRAIRRERGELGDDHLLRTKDGPTAFAVGDRVQFAGSAYSRADKQRGLVNGNMGEILEIEGSRVTVALDGKGKEPRRVSFTVGADEKAGEFNALRHGYAGTIYKGQGRTLDETYLYHSQHWRAASAYVGLTRHRERTRLYVARDVTRGREPWMMAEGGYSGLDERQQESAARSYEAWSEANPEAAAKYGITDYVAYVQEQQRQRGRTGYDLDQLTRQISRTDETRAASHFMADVPTATDAASFAKQQAAERVRQRAATGRYAGLRAGAEMVAALWQAAKDALQRGKAKAEPVDPLAAIQAELDAYRREQEQEQDQGPSLGL